MVQDMPVELGVESIVAAKLAEGLAAEVASTLQRRCHMLVEGWAITHRRRHISMLAGGQVNSGYFRSQQRPDPITVFVSPFPVAWGFFYCCLYCIICSHQVQHSQPHCLHHHQKL